MAENGEDTTGIFNYMRAIRPHRGGPGPETRSERRVCADRAQPQAGASRDYLVSRGEYLCARLLAAALDWEFIDAAEVILFDARGRFNPDGTHEKLSARLRVAKNAVIPGFYGSMPDGRIKTFSRGIRHLGRARSPGNIGVGVRELDRRTGLYDGRPAHRIGRADHRHHYVQELRELAYMGAQVLRRFDISRKAGGYPDPYPQHKLSEGSRHAHREQGRVPP